MRYIKCISVLLVSIFLISSIQPATTAQSGEYTLLDNILLRIFKRSMTGTVIKYIKFIFPWNFQRFVEPENFTAVPSYLDIEYLNQTEIIIGVKNQSTGKYVALKELNEQVNHLGLFDSIDYEFKLDIPKDVPEEAFIATFDPPTFSLDEEGEAKTKLILTTNIPKIFSLPENILLQVNISRYVTAGNLYIRPDIGIGWFISAVMYGFGKAYSGKRVYDEPSMYVNLVVKVNRFHLAKITPPQNIELKPDEVTSIPIEIENQGSHVDTFNFKVTASPSNSGLIISPPSSITLAPGESGHTSIGIVSPPNFQDPGTVHSITIEASSIYDPDKVFTNTVTLTTRGVYVSEMGGIYSGFFGVIILLVVAFFLYRRKKRFDKICEKPEKPWDLPDEKEYLEELKTKDEKEYNEVLKMMQDEYKSALLWYKSYIEVMIKKEKQKTVPIGKKLAFITDIFKKPKVKKVEAKKPATSKPKEKKIPVKTEKVEEEIPEKIDTEAAIAERKKQEIILRIKREQEKQKKKVKPWV